MRTREIIKLAKQFKDLEEFINECAEYGIYENPRIPRSIRNNCEECNFEYDKGCGECLANYMSAKWKELEAIHNKIWKGGK